MLEKKIVVQSVLEPAASALQSKRAPYWATSADR